MESHFPFFVSGAGAGIIALLWHRLCGTASKRRKKMKSYKLFMFAAPVIPLGGRLLHCTIAFFAVTILFDDIEYAFVSLKSMGMDGVDGRPQTQTPRKAGRVFDNDNNLRNLEKIREYNQDILKLVIGKNNYLTSNSYEYNEDLRKTIVKIRDNYTELTTKNVNNKGE
jgi:hypothetical protein